MSTATLPPPLTKKDFQTDQEVRWCPGCGDYAILSAVQAVFPPGTWDQEGKFCHRLRHRLLQPLPYYMNTYGFHTIHGRAPAVATGLKAIRPDLEVWVATGDEMRSRLAAITPSTCCAETLASGAAVQQQDLRIDKGPILANFGTQQEGEIDTFWIIRPAVQSRIAGHRFRGHVRGSFR